jgi:hypothetical protein
VSVKQRACATSVAVVWWWWSDVDRRVGWLGGVWARAREMTDKPNSGCRLRGRAMSRMQETVQVCHEKRVSGGSRQRSGEQVGEGSVSL